MLWPSKLTRLTYLAQIRASSGITYQAPLLRVDPIDSIWCKFTYYFWRVDHFIPMKNMSVIIKWSSLQKFDNKFTPELIYTCRHRRFTMSPIKVLYTQVILQYTPLVSFLKIWQVCSLSCIASHSVTGVTTSDFKRWEIASPGDLYLVRNWP